MKLKKVLGRIVLALSGVIGLVLAAALLAYPPMYVFRVLAYQESDALDWQKFPNHALTAATTPYHFKAALNPRVEELFMQLSGAEDWNRFLEENHTQDLIVIQDGNILYESYFNGAKRDSMATSFSVAKSYTSALIGIAIQDGYIKSVEDPITKSLPELAKRDARFQDITIRDLLRMAAGLEYKSFRPLLFNSDDILTTYYPNQRKLALENTQIIDPPGQYFLYNKYHPQLLGMILERATGLTVTQYLQTRIWNQLGMEYDGSWSTDSRTSDFEKMETGVNARAIDFAKFGVLFLNGGAWQGKQVIDKAWVDESTGPWSPQTGSTYYPEFFARLPGKAYYAYMWWGMDRADGRYDFAAEGNKGQFIYVSPAHQMVIVRNGFEYGIPMEEWMRLFYEFAERY